MKRKLLALAVVLALCSGCQSESTGSANLPQYENLIFRYDVEKAQPEETKQKEKTVLPQNLKQALNDYCRVLDQAKKDGLVASRTGDHERIAAEAGTGRIYRGDKVSETRVSHFQGAEFPAG